MNKRILVIFSLIGCAGPNSEDTSDYTDNEVGEWFQAIQVDEDVYARTKTYYVSNPDSGGCSSAVKLTAKGTSITKISPSGCEISCTGCGTAPTWDSLTSSGTSSLSDTWYNRSNKFDKDYTSANGEAWCDSHSPATVVVTGSSITSLSYWFTDDGDCWF